MEKGEVARESLVVSPFGRFAGKPGVREHIFVLCGSPGAFDLRTPSAEEMVWIAGHVPEVAAAVEAVEVFKEV